MSDQCVSVSDSVIMSDQYSDIHYMSSCNVKCFTYTDFEATYILLAGVNMSMHVDQSLYNQCWSCSYLVLVLQQVISM